MTDRDDQLSLVVAQAAEEFTAAIEAGEQPDIDDFVKRYPLAADVLRTVLPALTSLTSEQASNGFASESTAAASAFSDGDPLRLPHLKKLGDFQLDEPIGRGGMGVVYRATQLSIGRIVAVKVLPFAATLDETQLQRFRNEVRAAGTLNHPNIVPIYAMGEQRGVHYYAMQLIRGCSLAELIEAICVQSSLAETTGDKVLEDTIAVANALEVTRPINLPDTSAGGHNPLFRQVATLGRQAALGLSHAHACGVTHRDIKPANVMIDMSGKLWITDFGLAHVESGQSLTMPGDFIGTLRYMSPEQAEGIAAHVDHRADIYSLGVSLYELLTGQAAVTGETREQIINAVVNIEPTSPRRINASIPIELETIVLKACEKNPQDRYATADALAEDLARYLDRKPIVAKRRTSIDKARRWTHRNSLTVLATAAVTTVLLGITLAASFWIWHERNNAQQSVIAEQVERGRKEETLKAARKAMERIYLEQEASLRNEGGMTAKRRETLEEVLRFYESLPAAESGKPELRFESAMVRKRLGDVNQHLGRFDRSRSEYEGAISLLDSLVVEDPANADYLSLAAMCKTQLGVVFSRVGDNVQACAAYRESIDSLDELKRIGSVKSINGEPWSTDLLVASTNQLMAESLAEVGRHDEAIDYSKQAMNLAKRLFHEYPSEPEVCHQVIKILQGHANLVFRTSGVGDSERDVAREMETALKLAKAMQKQFPHEATSAALVATIACDYSLVCNQKGQINQARDLITESIQIREELAARFPHRPALLVEQSNSHDRYASILHDQQQYDEAIEQYRIAVALDERAAQSDEFDRSLGFRRMAIGKQQNLSNTLWRTRQLEGRLDECRQIREQTVAEWKSLVDAYPDQPDLKADYAMALYALADLKSAADSIELVNESAAIMQTLCEAFPNNPGHKSRLTTCLKALAGHYISNRQPELAIETAQSSIRVAEELARQWPTVPDYRGKIARRYRLLGQIYLHLKENNKAAECFQNALKSREQLQSLSTEYSTSMYAIPVASLHTLLAVAHRRMNDPQNDILACVHFDTAAKMAVEANAMKDLANEVTFMLNAQERQILSQFIAKALESRYDNRAHESESETR